MHKQLQGLQATAETIRESAKGLLEPLSTQLTKIVENTFQKITSVYSQSLSVMSWARGIDPKISLKDAGLSENSFCQNESVYLHELVYAARTALLRGTVPVSR